jgi:hypothetical protein
MTIGRLIAVASLASALGTFSTSARACIPPAPLTPLPAEAEALFQARTKTYFQAIGDEERRTFQIGLGQRAKSYFLGVVTASQGVDLGRGTAGRMVSVRPLKALRGALPEAPFTLRDTAMTSCGPVGGGPATTALLGEYVVVFRDVSLGGGVGIEDFGLRAQDARAPFLLGALNDFAREQRDSARKTQ